MANRIAGRPWTLDTPTPGVPIWHSWTKIGNIIWSGYAADGDTVTLNDVNNALVFSANGKSDLSDIVSWRIGWVQGLIPQVIGSGVVIVYIE